MESTSYGHGAIALLVDGQNISPAYIDPIVKEVSKYGQIRIKRLYGDWKDGQMGKWDDKAIEHAMKPEQIIAPVKGKNAADIKLVIDAMDFMNKKAVETICIVSSDSDFSQLATKLREEGITVIGVGEAKTNKSLQNACEKFIFIENLVHHEQLTDEGKKAGAKKNTGEVEVSAPIKLDPKKAVPTLTQAINNASDEDGWVHLSVLRQSINRVDTSFDERTYGKSKLIDLIKALNANFELEQDGKNGAGGAYVRIKPNH